ncbi:hypothetical protein [Hyphomicrobium sp.]|uniref:hypothetical protein n=1 Tax=Hyphomicrobium sp. TaxID=82 RepID=UPI002E2EE0D6|nr:hypothetical protein [Hyphomicrobium sp.]HEX2839961.1 hypothetical protein [Hyphomicrobium sp.]
MNQNERDKETPTGQMSGEAFRAYSQRQTPTDSESLETFWESFYSKNVDPYRSAQEKQLKLSELDIARLTALAGIVQGTSRQFILRSFATFPYANECERQIVEAVVGAKEKYLNEPELVWEPESITRRLYAFLKQLPILSEDVQFSVEFLKENGVERKQVADERLDVSNKTHMVTREQLLKEVFEKAGLLTLEELVEIRRRIDRMVFMHGREEAEAKVLAILAHPENQPPKFKDREPGEDVVSFLKREYGRRGLLKGYLTRKILRDFDATCEAELSRFIRANGDVPELNIPKAINFPDGDKVRSRYRDRTIS